MRSKSKPKLQVDLLFGGRSQEHEIAILSAAAILNELVKMRQEFEVSGVYLSKEGDWFRSQSPLSHPVDVSSLKKLEKNGIAVSPSVNPRVPVYYSAGGELPLPDLFFPVLHGTNGEDGTIQGLFELMGKPFVGSSVLGGSCGMDKEAMKRLFVSEGLPVLPWAAFHEEDWRDKSGAEEILKKIGSYFRYPVFVKPSSLGSSVGISKAKDLESLRLSIGLAFRHGKKILVEEGRGVREIECAVLGNHHLRASCLGEIVPGADFYDFEDKYKTGTAALTIPAKLPSSKAQAITQMALKAYRVIGALGLSRVDFFLCKDTGETFVNEINTFPGFTKNSMYPKLMAHSGLAFPDLLRELIRLGLERSEP